MASDGLRCCSNCEHSGIVLTLGGRHMTICDGQDGDMREVMGNFRCDGFEPWERQSGYELDTRGGGADD